MLELKLECLYHLEEYDKFIEFSMSLINASHPNNITAINFMPHAMLLGRDFINFLDSKNYCIDYAEFPNLKSIFGFFKTIVGAYNTLKLEKKNNSLFGKLELLKKTTDVVSLNFLMLSVVELLFSISDGFSKYTNYSFSRSFADYFYHQKLLYWKTLCAYVDSSIFLHETSSDRIEPNIVIGDYDSALNEAEKLIDFRDSTLKTIEEMIKAKYQFYMSYKAYNAMQIVQYHSLYLDKRISNSKDAYNKFSAVLDIHIHSIHVIEQTPQFFISKNEYEWRINHKPFLVDNSDYSLINYCQSPPQYFYFLIQSSKYTEEIKNTCDLHKLYALKFRKILIDNTCSLFKLTLVPFTISDLKNHVDNALKNLQNIVKIGNSLPNLPANFDFILCDVSQQVFLWKKYDFFSTLCEFYNELHFIIENKNDSVSSIGFTALCNRLNFLIYETKIFKLSTIILEVFHLIKNKISSIVSTDYRYLISYTSSRLPETKYIRDFLSKTNRLLCASISSVSEQLKKCLTYIQDPEFNADIKGRYLS
ncbi:hypothetical protein MXB_4903 [Myxobolus squamalis]|nr:hypothetical protein MXB_4903 [Myxobolus squamalis]